LRKKKKRFFSQGALAVGVLTGAAGREDLGSADVLLESVADIDSAMLAEWAGGGGGGGALQSYHVNGTCVQS
jgi:hypothetical protein